MLSENEINKDDLIEGHDKEQLDNNKKALAALVLESDVCIIFAAKRAIDINVPAETFNSASGVMGKTDHLMQLCANSLIQMVNQYPTIAAFGIAKAVEHMNRLVQEQKATNGAEIEN